MAQINPINIILASKSTPFLFGLQRSRCDSDRRARQDTRESRYRVLPIRNRENGSWPPVVLVLSCSLRGSEVLMGKSDKPIRGNRNSVLSNRVRY